MEKFKVVLFDRKDSTQNPGGDTIQIYAIAKFLEENNIYVAIINDLNNVDLLKFDIAILFNLTRPYELYLQTKIVRNAGIPYILFPIYWNLDKVVKSAGFNIRSMFKFILTHKGSDVIRAFKFYSQNKTIVKKLSINLLLLLNKKKFIEKILEHSLYICPNSNAEATHLLDQFRCKKMEGKIVVVNNGININHDIRPPSSQELVSLKDSIYVCCVGGIGPRKNQLSLIRAAKLTALPLVIVGGYSEENEGYFNKLRREAGNNVYFAGHLHRQEVQWIMAHSSGHIQPSYVETPGLASLEAASLGINIGVSNIPPVKEYFKDYAEYCDPNSVESIAECMLALVKNNKRSIETKEFITKNYQWRVVLQPLIKLVTVAGHENRM
ncbi:glycosyltransferase [Paenibacillus sp. J2TS4]|uniref:glycosyltransferase n=1 Tax=Paenibacillus sp. J2TS4 TaxID=2807194 RepID=UPI001B0F4D43|nr:glycosyltransferase [Paenibacillus sp. J2TS4]GIP35117.1 hypothetical protein J2TS4_43270 [Paenibacillus sp. J2TS4]